MPKYLSPTAIKTWEDNRDTYYLWYLCEHRTPRPPQTPPMAIGSAFDAYVKSFLVEKLIGKRPEFEFTTIFEAQVEPHNRDEALKAGKYVFTCYSQNGALVDILADLKGCIGAPKFEATIEAYIGATTLAIGDVPLLGKPDIFFITKTGRRVIFDWKVNGFYSKSAVSPMQGYARLRPGGDTHKDCIHCVDRGTHGIWLNKSDNHTLCKLNPEWAAQCAIYAWLLGEPIGSDFVAAIDQIVCKPQPGNYPLLRVAQHRTIVTREFQEALFRRAHKIWYQVQSGHIFDWLTKEQSDARCRLLDTMAQAPADPDFDELVR